MSKVLVDRELLAGVCSMVPDKMKAARKELRAILAQPAEAEGVRDYLTEFAEGEVEAKTAIEELQDALSAVTAERDRLLQEKGDPAGSFEKCMQAMRDRDEHARTIDRLRAEVERLRRQLQTAHSFIESTEAFGSAAASGILECAGAVWNIDESKALIAAMAAKEAGPEHVCSGCGAKGWTGNCLECIPY